MKKINTKTIQPIRDCLAAGGVGVMPTDTIYGLVGAALNKKTVRRIYQLKRRSPAKPFIILISDLKQLNLFGVSLDADTLKILKRCWPGRVSVVLPCDKLTSRYSYLRPKNKTLAFRCPQDVWLRKLISQVGPLAAPSANREGHPPSQNIKQAKVYFSDQVDFYLDAGLIKALPSTLIAIKGGHVIIERQGKKKLNLC